MIVPYYGEFLHFPIPLELSYGVCSHNCAYCFAKFNQRQRKVEMKQIMNLLADYHNRDTLTATLLQEGYPVVLSNRCDPFAKSNYQYTMPLIKTMTDLGIPLSFETKTGWGIDEALEFLQPAVWYITVEMLDTDIAKRIDPGAPSPLERIATIKKLTSMGHRVVAAFNPLVPEWLPDVEPLVELLQGAGVEGVWVDKIHLSSEQIGKMQLWEIEALGDNVIKNSKKLGDKMKSAEYLYALNATQVLNDYGISVYYPGYDKRSDFFNPYTETYAKTFPTLQEFVNRCFDLDLTPSEPFGFTDFCDFFLPDLPQGEYTGMRDYVFTGDFDLRKVYKLPAGKMNYKQLLAIGYDSGKIRWSPTKLSTFAWPGFIDEDGERGVYQNTEDNLPFMVFTPFGFNDYYFDDLPDGVIDAV